MRRSFPVLYVIFLVICVLYPFKTIVGPVAFRHVFSLFLLGVCIREGFRSDKYLHLYFIFLFFLAISSTLTGYIGFFFNKLLGTYMPFITAYAATYLLIKKYNCAGLLAWLIVGFAVFDAIVTIGQFFNLDYVERIYSIMNMDLDEEFGEKMGRKDMLEGYAIAGIFDSVANGYFLSATAILALFNKKCSIIFRILLWLIILVASLLAQERSGFFMALAFSVFIIGRFFMSKGKKLGIIMVVVFVAIAGFFILSNVDLLFSSNLRFAKGFENDGRESFRAVAWDYLFQNPLGGFYDFMESGNRGSHSFFVNAFLYGGIFGGLCVIVLVILQVVKILPYLFSKPKTEYAEWSFIWGLMYIDYTINSMVHNASIMSGTLFFFVWWGAFLGFVALDERERIIKRQAV